MIELEDFRKLTQEEIIKTIKSVDLRVSNTNFINELKIINDTTGIFQCIDKNHTPKIFNSGTEYFDYAYWTVAILALKKLGEE